LEEAVHHHGLEVHAYALMPNHYHLLVRSRLGLLSAGMKHLNATYTLRANRRHGWDGPIFRGRFRSQRIADERYLDSVFAYVHLNPHRAGLAKALDEPCWTSLRAYLGKERAPEWLCREFFLARLGSAAGIAAALHELRKRPEAWPDGFERESGWIKEASEGAEGGERLRRRPELRTRTISEVLARVARVSSSSVTALKQRAMGPGANPARRLAVWALSREGVYSQRDIGAALRMSEGQVAKVLWRLRSAPPPAELSNWMSALADEGDHVSSGRS
jgi:REP element-mobilizing transposase RayT